jgi:hypothetical protein
MNSTQQNIKSTAILPGSDSEFIPCPTVMTEEELIRFLRIPEISNARNHRNVVDNLDNFRKKCKNTKKSKNQVQT